MKDDLFFDDVWIEEKFFGEEVENLFFVDEVDLDIEVIVSVVVGDYVFVVVLDGIECSIMVEWWGVGYFG